MCDCMYCEPLSWLYLLSVSPLSVILLSCGDSSSFCMIGAQVILFFSRYRIWANNVSSESEIQLDNQTTFKWVHFWEVWDSYVLGLQCFGISLRREWVLFRITIHNTLSSNVITPVWFRMILQRRFTLSGREPAVRWNRNPTQVCNAVIIVTIIVIVNSLSELQLIKWIHYHSKPSHTFVSK